MRTALIAFLFLVASGIAVAVTKSDVFDAPVQADIDRVTLEYSACLVSTPNDKCWFLTIHACKSAKIAGIKSSCGSTSKKVTADVAASITSIASTQALGSLSL